jgi:hypothetical protein
MNLRMAFQQKKAVAPGDTFWQLTYTINFQAKKAGAKLHAAFPGDTAHGRVFHHEMPVGDIELEGTRKPKSQNREIGLSTTRVGPYSVKAQFQIHLSPRAMWRDNSQWAGLTAEVRADYLKSEKLVQADDPLVIETLDNLRDTASGGRPQLLERLFDYCVTEISPGSREAPADAVSALKQRTASTIGRARAMVALCRAAKLPARLVTGFQIKQGPDIRPHVWVEVAQNGRWEPYDPESAFSRELPHNFLPVRYDGAAIVRSADMTDVRSAFSVVRTPPPPTLFRSDVPRLSDFLDLSRLPLELKNAFALILLMPLGALVTAIFRTVIGIRTFGTFTPTLLALAFVYNDWRAGLLIFAVVLAIGLTSRSMLETLKLLLVPRLSVILTLVVLSMVFTISLLDHYGLTSSQQAVLLPMVILTSTIERLFLTTEEDSAAFAAQLFIGTAIVAVCCYMILRWERVGNFFLEYPEGHFLTIALLVMLGRYTGYRLTELWRFRDLGQPRS